MSRQFLRSVSLVVGDKGGHALDLSGLRITFQVIKGATLTPNAASIRIYNLSKATAARAQAEFTQVSLTAGYQDAPGVIFRGTIKGSRFGRENPTDTFLDLFAADGDRAYNQAVVNHTHAAGYTAKDLIGTVGKAMTTLGTDLGYTPDGLDETKMPRGRSLYGPAKDYAREVGTTTGTAPSIQDQRLQFVPHTGYLPGQAFVLTSATGLIGLPTQTPDGIQARCLLNPAMQINGLVQINNESVQRAATGLEFTFINTYPDVAADGFYKVVQITHTGDTRGEDYYSDLICVAVNGKGPITQSAAQMGVSN